MQRLLRASVGEARSKRVMTVSCSSSEALAGCSQQSVSCTRGWLGPPSMRMPGTSSAVVSAARAALRSAGVAFGGSVSSARAGDHCETTYSVSPMRRVPTSDPSIWMRLSKRGAAGLATDTTSSATWLRTSVGRNGSRPSVMQSMPGGQGLKPLFQPCPTIATRPPEADSCRPNVNGEFRPSVGGTASSPAGSARPSSWRRWTSRRDD